jgi:hypothetical protein
MTRLLLSSILVLVPALAWAQESKSAQIVAEFIRLLDQAKVDTVASSHAGGFAGAFYVPGSQLLVIHGRFASTERAAILVDRKMYRDLYTDLNSAAEIATRVFISDLGADGLKFRRANNNQPFDMADVGTKSYRFDGDWGKQKLSRDDYTKAFEATDEQYVQILRALIDQLKKP